MAWQHISPEVTVKGFKKCWIYNALDETDDDNVLWDGSEVDGNVRSECEEDETTDFEHWNMTYRIWHALCRKCVKLIVKYFFLADILILADHLS